MKFTDMETTLTFDQLPAAISLLIREVNSLKLALQAAPPEQADQLLTVDQAAAFLTLAKPTIYAMISRGDLPNLKRGKRVYFQKSDLLNYLKEGRRKTYQQIKEEARG
jgi:excisionase family DNA binding protein